MPPTSARCSSLSWATPRPMARLRLTSWVPRRCRRRFRPRSSPRCRASVDFDNGEFARQLSNPPPRSGRAPPTGSRHRTTTTSHEPASTTDTCRSGRHMANTTEHDPSRDERFQVAAMGVPGALPIGDLEPDAEDARSTGGLTPDGRKAEGGISGSSIRVGDRVFKALAAGSGGLLLVIMAAIAIFLFLLKIPASTENAGNIF